MGERHQAFLIARVVPYGETKPRYRCIAAYHHQWCCGTSPLRCVRRCMILLRQKENAEIIREELHSMNGKYGRFRREPEMPDIPCPFAVTLLGTSWDVDLSPEFPYLNGSCCDTLPANMGCWDGDNDEGITVIDVSNPEDPAYRFVKQATLTKKATLLTGKEYIQYYYKIPKEGEKLDRIQQGIVDSLAGIEGERLLGRRALDEAWPTRFRGSSDAGVSTDESSMPAFPALSILALRPAVLQSIESGDTEALQEMLWLPGKAEIVREILLKQSPFPDNGIPLLRRIVEQDATESPSVDLSGADLSDAQVMKTLHGLSNISSLNLSRAPRITAQVVREIIMELPHLRRLVVMNCPSIFDADLHNLLDVQPHLFYKLEALMHPAFLNYGPETWTPEITFMMMLQECSRGVPLPWISTASVVQGFTDLMQVALNDPDSFGYDSGAAMEAAFTAGPRASGRKWGERSITAVTRFDYRLLVSSKRARWLFLCCNGYAWSSQDNRGWGFIRFPPSTPPRATGTEEHAPENKEEDGSDTGSNKADAPAPEKSHKQLDMPQFEVHDLRGFLRILVEEGRPEVPEDAIAHAEKLAQKLAETPQREGSSCRLFSFETASMYLRGWMKL